MTVTITVEEVDGVRVARVRGEAHEDISSSLAASLLRQYADDLDVQGFEMGDDE